MQKKLVFGVHIPKCAGTTILERVKSCLPKGQIYQSTSIIQNLQQNRPEFLYLPDLNQIRFIFGHAVHEQMLRVLKRPVFLFTGLREPDKRLKSQIDHLISVRADQGLDPPNIQAAAARHDNPLSRFLVERFPTLAGQDGSLSDRAMRVLECCSAVYFTDTFEQSAATIFEQLGITPEPRDHNMGQDHVGEIDISRATLDQDWELYRRAREWPGLSERGQERLEHFIAGEPDIDVLRQHLFNRYFNEYKNWGALDRVISRKSEILSNLAAEIAYYTERRGA